MTSTLVAALSQVGLAFAIAGAFLRHVIRPLTWRRPVRAEFWRFIDMVLIGNLRPVIVTALLIGFVLISRGIFWLEQLGDIEEVRSLLLSALIREISPILVAFLTLGRAGMVLLGEIGGLRGAGLLKGLERQGLDPFILLVVPRGAAIIIATFCHTIIFILVAFLTGYLGALTAGITRTTFPQFVANMLNALGAAGFIAIPFKSFVIGLTITAVCSLSALLPTKEPGFGPISAAQSLIRAVSSLLIVFGLLAIVV
jgi:phospholipid/cholesterol/gamma-HCH transport system permease protein